MINRGPEYEQRPPGAPRTTVTPAAWRFFSSFEDRGWYSLRYPDLRGLFLPKPNDLLLTLPGASLGAIVEVQDLYRTLDRTEAGFVPERKDLVGRKGVVTVRGEQELPPVPHRFSIAILSPFLENPLLKLTSDEIFAIWRKTYPERRLMIGIQGEMKKVAENIGILRSLQLLPFRLKNENGVYRLVSAIPAQSDPHLGPSSNPH